MIKGKKGFEMPWTVLLPLIVLVALTVIYLVFNGTAGKTIENALRYIGDLFKFGG
ncbi:MAG: hypothetical protein Q7S27_04340 [Nanoarchaeota archaeon]|nr:hypothetical protein [Nanoarchaeota archaeon]